MQKVEYIFGEPMTITRTLRKCTITGELQICGADGLTDAEREWFEAFNKEYGI